MSLHHHSSEVPALLATAEQIREAARAFNTDFPEATAEIDAGIPIIDVRGDTGIKDTRHCRVFVAAGLITSNGGFIYAHEPHVLVFRSFDGRVAPQEQGARLLRKHLAAVEVEVRKTRVSSY
ncbi:hypothetical protein [Nonomuraea sp. NPDC023979]|uniref:hypothetical protein n=1 Tax=Nonomuraea sp. NPDC023979 TaxID=3154796 RepID=UPI0033E8C46C